MDARENSRPKESTEGRKEKMDVKYWEKAQSKENNEGGKKKI